MNKKIAVFFKAPNSKDYPFNEEEYWVAYQELDAEIRALGAEFFIVRDNKTYLGDGKFSKSWQFKNGNLIETGEIQIDKIYDKGGFKNDGKIPVLNNEIINRICNEDKWETYTLFKKNCPKTILVKNEKEFLGALAELDGDKKVIKPIDGSGGKGVFIGDDKYLKSCPKKFPILTQEFLDTSEGIPEIYKGIHDLRIVFINDDLIYSFYRTPPKGKLLANVAQGGSLAFISKDKIPKSAIKIANKVNTVLSQYGDRVFSIDFGFVKGIPKIIELNSMVGLGTFKEGSANLIFMQKLAKILIKKL